MPYAFCGACDTANGSFSIFRDDDDSDLYYDDSFFGCPFFDCYFGDDFFF